MDNILNFIFFCFMVLGAVDYAFFNNRFGYGKEFTNGLATMGPLCLTMAGIMCGAPVLGQILVYYFSGIIQSVGIDIGMFGGMLLAVDMGGLPLVQQMAINSNSILLSGVLLGSTLGAIISFIVPVGLTFCPENMRNSAAKGILVGIIVSPLCALIGGLYAKIDIFIILHSLAPVLIFNFFLAILLVYAQNVTIRAFLCLSRVITCFFTGLLLLAIFQDLFKITIVEGMGSLNEQLVVIGHIGITLAGTYPFVKFICKYGNWIINKIANSLSIDYVAASCLIIALANPLPVFSLLHKMTARGIACVFAFLSLATTVFGDHLGYISTVYASAVGPMVVGKLLSGIIALLVTSWFIKCEE